MITLIPQSGKLRLPLPILCANKRVKKINK